MRDKFNTLLQSFENDTSETRQTIGKLIDPANTQAALEGQATMFVVGDEQRAAVHSEPPITIERIFMSILPGTHAQIAELRERWGRPETTYKPETTPAPQPLNPKM